MRRAEFSRFLYEFDWCLLLSMGLGCWSCSRFCNLCKSDQSLLLSSMLRLTSVCVSHRMPRNPATTRRNVKTSLGCSWETLRDTGRCQIRSSSAISPTVAVLAFVLYALEEHVGDGMNRTFERFLCSQAWSEQESVYHWRAQIDLAELFIGNKVLLWTRVMTARLQLISLIPECWCSKKVVFWAYWSLLPPQPWRLLHESFALEPLKRPDQVQVKNTCRSIWLRSDRL